MSIELKNCIGLFCYLFAFKNIIDLHYSLREEYETFKKDGFGLKDFILSYVHLTPGIGAFILLVHFMFVIFTGCVFKTLCF